MTALNYTTKTRIEWFNAEGELLDTIEVPGDATAVLYDPERGAHMPLVPEPPAGAVRAVSRIFYEVAPPEAAKQARWIAMMRGQKAALAAKLEQTEDDLAAARAAVERLQDWKDSASEVMRGLQDLGKALGLPLGASITGTAAAEVAEWLRAKVARVEALRDAAIASEIESRVRAARDDVRCLHCNLRYGERQEYGCLDTGWAHTYDEGDLAAAEQIERYGSVEHVTLAVADLNAALAEPERNEGR